jgi:hypothetical protein
MVVIDCDNGMRFCLADEWRNVSRGGASGSPLTLMLAATLVAYALDVTPDRLVQLALLFVGSLWAQRMLYVASTWFLRLAVYAITRRWTPFAMD